MLFEELDIIKERHGVHGIRKIEDLELFLTGLKAAGRIYTFSLRSDPDFLAFIDFQNWLKDKHFKVAYGKTWIELIREQAKDDVHSLQLFFQLLDRFREVRAQNQQRIK